MKKEFDTKKVYMKIYKKKELISILNGMLDSKFRVVFIPTSKTSCDILITDVI